jgi:hypothetical protein
LGRGLLHGSSFRSFDKERATGLRLLRAPLFFK